MKKIQQYDPKFNEFISILLSNHFMKKPEQIKLQKSIF